MKRYVFCLLFFASFLTAQDIDHVPFQSVFAGESQQISITINRDVRNVKLHYRTNIADRFSVVDLDQEGFYYKTSIDIPSRGYSELEYFFSIEETAGTAFTFPLQNAQDQPFKAIIVKKSNEMSLNYEIITPLDGETLDKEDFIVAVSFLDESNKIDPKRTILKINGVNVTNRADITEELVSFIGGPTLRPGTQKISISLYNSKGTLLKTISWSANVRGETTASAVDWRMSGDVRLEQRNEEFGVGESADKREITNMNAYVGGYVGKLDYTSRARISTEQTDERQDVNKFHVGLNYDDLILLGLMDVNPNYQPLIFQNKSLRGFRGGIYTGWVNLDYAQGRFNKEIRQDTLTNVNGAYLREVFAGRLSFGRKKNDFEWGLSALRSRDKDLIDGVDSLGRPVSVSDSLISKFLHPEDNFVAGSDLYFALMDKKIIVHAGGAASLFMENTRGGTVPYDTLVSKGGDDIESSLSEENYDLINNVITVASLPTIDFSFFGNATIKLANNYFKVGYEQVGEGFRSHGDPFLTSGKRNLTFFDRIYLLDNQISVNASYRKEQNFLNKNDSVTNEINKFRFGLSYFPFANWPSVNLNFGKSDQSKLGTETNSFSVDLTKSFEVMNIRNSIVVSYGNNITDHTALTDTLGNVTLDLNTEGKNMFFNLVSDFEIPMKSRLSYSTYENISSYSESTSGDFAMRLDYDLEKQFAISLKPYASIKLVTGETILDDVEQPSGKRTITDDRNVFEFGANYYLPLQGNQSLSARASFRNISFAGGDDVDAYTNSYLTLSLQYRF